MLDIGLTMTRPSHALLHLLHLVSPALPIGAYAYSQGLEYAVSAGWVKDEKGAAKWIIGVLENSIARLDVPVLIRLFRAWQSDDQKSVRYWTAFLHANRESDELQREDLHLGRALALVLVNIQQERARPWVDADVTSFATLFACAAATKGVTESDAVLGYLWSWLENQIMAAIKLIPLGQSAGQRILLEAMNAIVYAQERGSALADAEIGALAPGLAISSALHETQYSRLFRS